MCDENTGSHNTEAHTTDESTDDYLHSDIETLGDLADRLERLAAGWGTSEYERGVQIGFECAAADIRQFRDDLETDIEELRAKGEDLYAQINDMASTAEMLEQAGQASETDRRATGRELATEALDDVWVELTTFRAITVYRNPDGSIQEIEVELVVGRTSQFEMTLTVGYIVDDETARPVDIEPEHNYDVELAWLAAIPAANEAIETHVDDITQTVTLTDFAHALYERTDDDDTPSLLELGQQHGAVADDQQDVRADGGGA